MTAPQKRTPDLGEYQALIQLLAVYTEATNRLAEIQTIANDSLLESLDEQKGDYATYQLALDNAEKAIKDLAAAHPEWLDGRTIKTPYGAVRFTRAKSLVIPDGEITLRLIRTHLGDRSATYVRTVEEPNKEALDTLDDETLAKLGVQRVETDSLKVTPAKVDMGKAAKKSEKKGEA